MELFSGSHQDTTKCPSCSKGHSLEKCPQFKSKSLDQRRKLVLSHGLCFGCLKKGHLSSSCRSRIKCGECGKSRPTLLHEIKPNKRFPKQNNKETERSPAQEKPKESLQTTPTAESADTNASTCGSTSLNCGEESDVVTAMFVPVILSHKDQPDIKIRVYALLGDGSDSTFVKTQF